MLTEVDPAETRSACAVTVTLVFLHNGPVENKGEQNADALHVLCPGVAPHAAAA